MSKAKQRSMENYKEISKEMEIILDNIAGFVFLKDTNNNFIRVNKRIADAYNYSKEELARKNLFELHSKEQAQAYWEDDLEVIRTGKSKLNIEEKWETEEGIRWLNTNKIPYIDDNGRIKGVIGFSVDITEHKLAEGKLKESKAKLQVLNEELELIVEKKNHALGERVKELTCLYDVSKLINDSNTINEKVLQKIINRINLSLQYSKLTCTRIIIDGQEYKTNNFKSTSQNLSADIIVDLNKIGIIEIFYFEEKSPSYYDLFLQEEQDLINAIAEILGRSIKRKQAETKLRETEIRYRTTFEQSPDGIMIVDLDTLKAIEFNGAMCNILGYSSEEFAELQISDYVVKTDCAEVRARINNILKQGRDDFEIKMRTKNGEIMDIYVTAKVINLAGKTYFQSICRDITERKNAEDKIKEQYEFLSNVIDSLTHPFCVINTRDYSIELANFDIDDSNDPKNTTCYAQTHKLDKPCTGDHPCPLELVKETKEPVTVEHIHTDQEGNPRYYDVHGFPIFDEKGKVIKMIEYNLDITERKKAEETLLGTLEKLKRSNEDLEQFAYIVSHDLQEPLRMVASFTQLLQKRYHDKLDTDANDFINFAVDGTTRMQRLINELLTYSRVGTRGKPFKATDMNYVLKSVLENSNQLIKETNAVIRCDPLPVIIADESQMIQLFQNLISNAIKFHDKKAPKIHVSGKVLKNEWRFSVQDNGIGIDSKFKERIFLIFQRLDKSNKYPGRGIGLAICKKIVQRHEGKIWVESEKEKGSTFYISILRKETNNYNLN